MEATEQKIRIAIVGGGLAGATVANALYQHPHLDIHVYEAAPKFSERGAAVGLATNALVALDLVIPSAREVVMDKAGAVPMHDNPMLFVCKISNSIRLLLQREYAGTIGNTI